MTEKVKCKTCEKENYKPFKKWHEAQKERSTDEMTIYDPKSNRFYNVEQLTVD